MKPTAIGRRSQVSVASSGAFTKPGSPPRGEASKRPPAWCPLPTTSTTTTMVKRHVRPARGESQCSFSPGTSLIVSVASQWEPIEAPADSLVDLATTLNQFAEGINLSPIPRRPLASVAEVDQVFEGLPFAGSTVSERLSRMAGPTHDGSSRGKARCSPSPEVTRAVGLTGEALMAWFRVLRSPGDLRISSR